MKQTLFLVAIIAVFLNSCSQYAAPIGGKKDTLAPVLLKSTPTDKQKNFNGQVIELAFNEYIRVENANQKILITPEPEVPFTYKARPTGVRLSFNKPFKPNTTYTFNFTDAIKDITENNPTTKLKLVFSTGNTIDSIRVGGRVIDIQTGRPTLNTLVGLYIPTDSLTPIKVKPYYFTRTDSSGNFLLENVKDGRYKVYAFDDKNQNLLLNPSTERVAFLKEELDLKANTDTIRLSLFPYYNTPPRSTRSEQRSTTYTLIFDRGIEQYTAHFDNPKDSLPSFLRTPTELTFFNTKAITDTVHVELSVTDSLKKSATIQQRIRFRTASRRDTPDPVSITVKPTDNEDVDRNLELALSFSKPIQRINTDSIQIISDSTTREVVTDQNYRWENNQTRLVLTKQTNARRDIRIRFGKGAFISVLNDSTAAQNLLYKIRDSEKYATLTGNVNTTAKQFIVELLDEQFKVVDRQLNKPAFRFVYIKPGKYRVRVIIDLTGNGRWDSGDPIEGRLPEPIYFSVPQLFPLKADFVINLDPINTL